MNAQDLPEQLRRVPGGVACDFCSRKWRLPEDGELSVPNFQFLCDHLELHRRLQRKPWRRRQLWRHPSSRS